MLGFLSGDRWTLSFTHEQAPVGAVARCQAPSRVPRRVVLLSGGADSAIGGRYSRSLLAPNEHHILLSHFSNTMLAPIQRHVAAEVGRPRTRADPAARGRASWSWQRADDGTTYRSEPTRPDSSLKGSSWPLGLRPFRRFIRCRSGSPRMDSRPLNPPLGPERLGLSTRTTHPAFLQNLAAVLTKAGAHAVIEKSLSPEHEGRDVQAGRRSWATTEASAFLSRTHSCALTGQRAHHISAEGPCGICFGCVLRRASFAASGVGGPDRLHRASNGRSFKKWLDGKSVEQPGRNFIRRGVRARGPRHAWPPDSYPLRDALDLCQRGITELRRLYP